MEYRQRNSSIPINILLLALDFVVAQPFFVAGAGGGGFLVVRVGLVAATDRIGGTFITLVMEAYVISIRACWTSID
ncbi:hypothetical protein BKA63DRAFT_190386 [Paraphoma chrysanthemicola]|nr:hypothetical protein BKA63DRAFT_190386 [Paraphoma chrysanthemicola]